MLHKRPGVTSGDQAELGSTHSGNTITGRLHKRCSRKAGLGWEGPQEANRKRFATPEVAARQKHLYTYHMHLAYATSIHLFPNHVACATHTHTHTRTHTYTLYAHCWDTYIRTHHVQNSYTTTHVHILHMYG